MSGIGEILRAGREGAGISRDELARTLRVPAATVAALEEERWGALPATVYIRGFVNSWCRATGIDPALARDSLLRSIGDAESVPPALPGAIRDTGITVGGRPVRRRARGRSAATGLAALLLLAAALATFMYLRDHGSGTATQPDRTPPGITKIGENGVCMPEPGSCPNPEPFFGE